MDLRRFGILIVDDEKNIREGLKKALAPLGYDIHLASDGREGLFLLMKEKVDLAIVDLQMPKLTGMELMEKMKEQKIQIPVIILTGHGNVDSAVEAMRLGAYNFLTKPTNIDKLEVLIQSALKQQKLEKTNQELVVQVKKFEIDRLIIGESKAIRVLVDLIHRVAPSRANVYIYGESGTGKELVCDAIHYLEPRSRPLIKVNCAALSPSLLESELFGHVKGAFTGADQDKKGRFEEANGGTIFLDEVSEIPPFIQVKLLRVLQERKIERVGSSQSIDLSIRIISASNRDLKIEVAKGKFREDLFYRLNVLDLKVPPLRHRRGDVGLLSKYFFRKFEQENKREFDVTPQVFSYLEEYSWPGNIRQLSNVIEKIVVLAKDDKITVQDLPQEVRELRASKNHSSESGVTMTESIEIKLGQSLKEIEEQVIKATIAYCRGNKSQAAEVLKIGRKSLYRKKDQ